MPDAPATTPMPKTKEPKPEKIVILAIRNRKKSINITWSQGADTHDDDFHENPRPSFYRALEELPAHIASLCDFPAADARKIVATGVTLRDEGDNTLAMVVGYKTVKRGGRPLNIATPLLLMEPDSENKTAACMTEAESDAIDKLVKEAKKYLSGDRAQGKIDFKAGEPEPDGKKKEDDAAKGTAALPFPPQAATGTAGATP